MPSYDIVVVGAGTGGCLAAWRAAKLGLKVLLVEHKPRGCIGDKVCGDAIGAHHFEALGLTPPRGEELANVIKGIEVYSPNREAVFKVEGEGLHGYIVNRWAFGQRLLKMALDAGAELMDSSTALDLVIEGGRALGVKVRTKGEVVEVYASVVVDATGYPSTLRRKAPSSWLMVNPPPEDYVVCYREIRRLEEPIERPEYCRIYLNQRISPGGYVWFFPRGSLEVNVGLGVQVGRGFNPRELFQRYVVGSLVSSKSSVVHKGGGVVPTRRPLDPLVGDGFMVIGDAACQANPIHGGGIGPSMRAGVLAAEAASQALDLGDVSARGLWSYAKRYMELYGYKQACLDAFRVFLQSLEDEDLDWGMKVRLVTERDLLAASMGKELKLSLTDKAYRLLRGVGRLSLLLKLRRTAEAMRRLRQLYLNYPEPEGLVRWRAEVEGVFNWLKEGLKG